MKTSRNKTWPSSHARAGASRTGVRGVRWRAAPGFAPRDRGRVDRPCESARWRHSSCRLDEAHGVERPAVGVMLQAVDGDDAEMLQPAGEHVGPDFTAVR